MKTAQLSIIAIGILIIMTGCGSGSGSSSGGSAAPVENVSVVTASKIADDLYQAQSLFGGDGYMYVKLDKDPGQSITVTVEHESGDPDQVIYAFASENGGAHAGVQTYDLSFDSSNWSTYQKIYFTAVTDSDAQTNWAAYLLTTSDISNFNDETVQSVPAVAADKAVTGTITRGAFAAALVTFDTEINDVTFTLSWLKVGTGIDARYYGSYTDNDPLNQLVSDGVTPEGNEDRNDYTYPAYGFWKDASLHFVIVKNLVTPRSTAEVNLVLLTAADEDFTSGTGYVTGTGASTSEYGSYDISFTAADDTPNNVVNIFPVVVDDPEFPVFDIDLQTQTYTPGAIGAANGQWELTADATDDYLFTGAARDADDNPAGTIHGFAYGSIDGQNKPNVISVLEDGGDTYIMGLPFYSEPDETFPFGSLGGRFVDMSGGTSERLFLFLTLTANN